MVLELENNGRSGHKKEKKHERKNATSASHLCSDREGDVLTSKVFQKKGHGLGIEMWKVGK